MKTALFTVDVESNCPPYGHGFEGIEQGLPKLLSLLDREKIPATFFVTAEVAEKYPKLIATISKKHEIGCHGYYHEDFSKLDYAKQFEIISSSKTKIEKIIKKKVYGFRAPRLRANNSLFNVLKKLNFKYDSSIASYKVPVKKNSLLKEITVTLTSSFLRFPKIANVLLRNKKEICIFVHPWEFIDIKGYLNWKGKIRIDNWIRTGDAGLKKVEETLVSLKNNGYSFKKCGDFIESRPDL